MCLESANNARAVALVRLVLILPKSSNPVIALYLQLTCENCPSVMSNPHTYRRRAGTLAGARANVGVQLIHINVRRRNCANVWPVERWALCLKKS